MRESCQSLIGEGSNGLIGALRGCILFLCGVAESQQGEVLARCAHRIQDVQQPRVRKISSQPSRKVHMQARAADERAEQLAQELRRRRGNREEVRAQLEREAEAGVKLQLQQRDLEWRQKYQVGQH